MSHKSSVIFDLDDTLYLESEFWIQSMSNALSVVGSLFNIDGGAIEEFLNLQSPQSQWIEAFVRQFQLPETAGKEILWLYRTFQVPKLTLMDGAERVLSLVSRNCSVGVITNGRSLAQRAKINSLRIKLDFLLISEEVGLQKPNIAIFEMAEKLAGAKQFFYVGDNPYIDFAAPRALGWETIRIVCPGQLPKSAEKFEYVLSDVKLNDFCSLYDYLEMRLK